MFATYNRWNAFIFLSRFFAVIVFYERKINFSACRHRFWKVRQLRQLPLRSLHKKNCEMFFWTRRMQFYSAYRNFFTRSLTNFQKISNFFHSKCYPRHVKWKIEQTGFKFLAQNAKMMKLRKLFSVDSFPNSRRLLRNFIKFPFASDFRKPESTKNAHKNYRSGYQTQDASFRRHLICMVYELQEMLRSDSLLTTSNLFES